MKMWNMKHRSVLLKQRVWRKGNHILKDKFLNKVISGI
jgi:hypothetical protein